MSRAKKCDICGKLYEQYSEKIGGENSRSVNDLVLVFIDKYGEYSKKGE